MQKFLKVFLGMTFILGTTLGALNIVFADEGEDLPVANKAKVYKTLNCVRDNLLGLIKEVAFQDDLFASIDEDREISLHDFREYFQHNKDVMNNCGKGIGMTFDGQDTVYFNYQIKNVGTDTKADIAIHNLKVKIPEVINIRTDDSGKNFIRKVYVPLVMEYENVVVEIKNCGVFCFVYQTIVDRMIASVSETPVNFKLPLILTKFPENKGFNVKGDINDNSDDILSSTGFAQLVINTILYKYRNMLNSVLNFIDFDIKLN